MEQAMPEQELNRAWRLIEVARGMVREHAAFRPLSTDPPRVTEKAGAGVYVTAGVGSAMSPQRIVALDAVSGKLLWRFNTGAQLAASPISYAVDGRQYVAISGTGGMFAFALPK